MNKLYRIKVLHAAPKDIHRSVETYLVAADEEAVFKFIDEKCYGCWSDAVKDGDTKYDDINGEIPFKEYIMTHRGDLDDDSGYEDAYYGVTKYGWEEVEAATDTDMERLIFLGIAQKLTQP